MSKKTTYPPGGRRRRKQAGEGEEAGCSRSQRSGIPEDAVTVSVHWACSARAIGLTRGVTEESSSRDCAGLPGGEVGVAPRWRWWIHLLLIGAYPFLGVILRSRQIPRASRLFRATQRGLLFACGVEITLFSVVFGLGWLASRASREELFFRWRPGWWVVPLGGCLLGGDSFRASGRGHGCRAHSLGDARVYAGDPSEVCGCQSPECGSLVVSPRSNPPPFLALVDHHTRQVFSSTGCAKP